MAPPCSGASTCGRQDVTDLEREQTADAAAKLRAKNDETEFLIEDRGEEPQ
jgi:hypothetical protein